MKIINLKVFFIALIIMFFISLNAVAQVGIGTANPNASSMLDITSPDKGFLPPRMDTTARDGITIPAAGLLIYNTSTNQLNYYNGTSWQEVETGAAGSYVDLTTNQTNIGGNKTFTNDITIDGTLTPNGRLILPMGELSYFDASPGGGTVISMPLESDGTTNMVQVNPASSGFAGTPTWFEIGSTKGSLKYKGSINRMFHIAITISGTPSVAGNVFVFGVAIGDGLGVNTIQPTGKVLGSSAGTQFSSLHIMLELSTGQELSLYIGNNSASDKTFIVKSLNFFAMGM